jgi:hypothetical protein
MVMTCAIGGERRCRRGSRCGISVNPECSCDVDGLSHPIGVGDYVTLLVLGNVLTVGLCKGNGGHKGGKNKSGGLHICSVWGGGGGLEDFVLN